MLLVFVVDCHIAGPGQHQGEFDCEGGRQRPGEGGRPFDKCGWCV